MADGLVLRALEVLKRASKDLQGMAAGGEQNFDEEDPRIHHQGVRSHKFDLYYSPSLKALLALQIESRSSGVLSVDPNLSTLRSLLSRLKDLCISAEIAAGDSRSNLLEVMQAKINNCARSKSGDIVAADSVSDCLQITQAKINDRSRSKSGEVVAADSRSNLLEMMQAKINDRSRSESGEIAAADSGGNLSEMMQAKINDNRYRSKSGEMDEADSSGNLFEKMQTKIDSCSRSASGENAAADSGDSLSEMVQTQEKINNCSKSISRDVAAEDSISNLSPTKISSHCRSKNSLSPTMQTKIKNCCRSKCSGEITPADSSGELSPIHQTIINNRCKSNSSEISRIAHSIESEIQSWIEREILRRLVSSLLSISTSSIQISRSQEDALAWLLQSFQNLLARGFNRKLQDLVLRSRIFPAIAAVLASPSAPLQIRDLCAMAVSSMVRFNRDVFVGHVLMGGSSPVHRSLSTMATPSSIRVLLFLVSSIKTAIVDELHSDGQLPSLVTFLSSPDTAIAESALELLLKIAYYARKEAIDAMIEANVVKKLVILQLSELGGALIAMEEERSSSSRQKPFVSCVARFAIQVEVGEGMRRREKIEAKGVILGRVKEAVESEADAAAISTEVLWGSSP